MKNNFYLDIFVKSDNIIFLEISVDGVILTYNKAAEQIFKYNKDEIIGQNISILYVKDLEKVTYDNFLSNEHFEGELPFCDKEGSKKWLFLFLYFLSDEKKYIFVAIDITDYREIIKKMEREIDTLEKVKFAANNGIWDWDLINNDVYFDEVYYKMAGYKPNEFPARLEEFKKRVHPDDIERVMESAKNHLEGKKPRYEEEFRFRRKDGSWMWILAKGIIVERDVNEKPRRFVGIHIDVTKLKNLEAKYKKLSVIKKAILESPEGIIIFALDKEYRYLYFTKLHKDTMKYIWGVDIEVGNNMLDYIKIEEDRIKAKRNFDRALRGEKFILYEEYGDINRRYYEDRYSPIYDEEGKIVGVAVFVIDITKLKDIQHKLEEKEEEYRKIFEVSEDIIFVVDAKTDKIITVNPAAYKLLGYTKEEFFNNKITYFFKNQEDRVHLFNESRRNNGRIQNFEITLKKKDGSILIGLLSGKNIYDSSNNVIGFHGTVRDITELKKMEMQLLHSQKMESLGLLAGGIAHDFNNFLTVINGYSEMLLMNLKKGTELYNNISVILETGKKAESLVKQLLAFSRNQDVDFKLLDINSVISSLKIIFRRTIGEDINLSFYLRENISYIKGDRNQLEQVLINLVVNARDAIRDLKDDNRKKYIIIETGETVFDERTILDKPGAKPGRYVYFSISDNGIGMDKELQRKVFDPFFTTKEIGRGSGLGLSTVYGIVKKHNGYIYIYSERLVGTTIEVYLPAISSKKSLEKSSDKEIKVNPYLRGNESILIVEDEEIVKNIEKSILEMFGYNVYSAQNGKEALEFLRRNRNIKIDLVVTDIVMPEMNGTDFIKKVLEFRSDFKVIFTSGYSDLNVFNMSLLDENVKFLHKPFSIEDFLKMVRSVLNKK